MTYTKESGVYLDSPKTKKSARYIDLPAALMKELRHHKSCQAEQRFNALLQQLEHYVSLFDPEGCVKYYEQTPTNVQKTQARENIGAATANHVHGIINGNGTVTGKGSYLVETDATGAIACVRRLICSDVHPSLLPDLRDGDIYLVPEE